MKSSYFYNCRLTLICAERSVFKDALPDTPPIPLQKSQMSPSSDLRGHFMQITFENIFSLSSKWIKPFPLHLLFVVLTDLKKYI